MCVCVCVPVVAVCVPLLEWLCGCCILYSLGEREDHFKSLEASQLCCFSFDWVHCPSVCPRRFCIE